MPCAPRALRYILRRLRSDAAGQAPVIREHRPPERRRGTVGRYTVPCCAECSTQMAQSLRLQSALRCRKILRIRLAMAVYTAMHARAESPTRAKAAALGPSASGYTTPKGNCQTIVMQLASRRRGRRGRHLTILDTCNGICKVPRRPLVVSHTARYRY